MVASQQNTNGTPPTKEDSLAAQGIRTENPQQIERMSWGYLNHLFADGYKRIKGNDKDARKRHKFLLSVGIERTIKRLRNNIKTSSIHAVLRDTLPLAKGLSFVLVTLLSNCRSQISLAIHPAPLTNNPPEIIIPKTNREGGGEGVNQRDQPAGMSSINLPLGLFHLRS
tara:strand:- start:24 stop:530 length:507 start_codon:yes stop_codon:yes gene_type:complete